MFKIGQHFEAFAVVRLSVDMNTMHRTYFARGMFSQALCGKRLFALPSGERDVEGTLILTPPIIESIFHHFLNACIMVLAV